MPHGLMTIEASRWWAVSVCVRVVQIAFFVRAFRAEQSEYIRNRDRALQVTD